MTHLINQLADAKALEFGPRFMNGEPLAQLLREYGAEVLRLAGTPSKAMELAGDAVDDLGAPYGSIERASFGMHWRAGIDALLQELEDG